MGGSATMPAAEPGALRSDADAAPGRQASNPWAMPWSAWYMVLRRTWAETTQDNMGLVAAGVAFYGFLAIVPMMAALVLLYGLAAEPKTVLQDIDGLAHLLPPYAANFFAQQLIEVVQASDGKKGLGLVVAIAVALFGARNGVGAIITALNIAYEQSETRNFVRVTLLSIGITAAAVLVAAVAAVAIASLGHLESLLPTLPGPLLGLGKLLSYVLLTVAGAAGAATLYRYGPDRANAKWVWLTPGSLLAGVGWLILSLGFGIYVSNFANYSATYGSLSAIVVILTWLYLSSYILLLGAELNSELEHQTERDTTKGPDRPLGSRNAWVADHVAPAEPSDKNSDPSASLDNETGRGRRGIREDTKAEAAARPVAHGDGNPQERSSALVLAAGIGCALLLMLGRRDRQPRREAIAGMADQS